MWKVFIKKKKKKKKKKKRGGGRKGEGRESEEGEK